MKNNIYIKFAITGIIFLLTALLIAQYSLPAKQIQNLDILNDSDIVNLRLENTEYKLKLEVASSPYKTSQGLMFKTKLPEDEGMIFIFDNLANRTFWMKNTLIPLDIIFLDGDLKVVSIYENTKINQTSEVYPSLLPAKYVIETNAHWSSHANLKLNNKFVLL
jgi:uncharacterized membrane protein (UPF0127 family)